ncbi:timeless-domain-containing protein [Pseudovirgaria hyperparasitica]|uniref:Topoisomerase 1-associated factor 1 n=1 Tax=Pseudovirgaria hyperparasitica TaxID=470096 RepID=A0A6A6WDU3_9PEZI|nr:timeless-domain-containing protein [Pseudovirgaria hyperparasitica]KAF2760988.1 timeless-domain-containing protein [Pseudovirgaria hyperparasitica]
MDPHDEDDYDATLEERISAYLFSLVSAIGGSSAEDDGRYRAGEEALYCLRDIRKLITAFDIKKNRFDVARAAAEANLVQGDLLELLAQWNGEEHDSIGAHRTVVAALEILVHLTWPIEIEPEDMTVNHHRHLPYLRLSQAEYKRAILHHPSSRILNSAVRASLPAMAESRKERSLRDESIIRILICLMRNVAALSHPMNVDTDFDDAEVSRSAVIDAFQQQDVFQVLLTMSSSTGEDFVDQDVILLETLFHLIKGVNVEKLFLDEQKLSSANTKDFKNLLNKEKAMLAGYTKTAPTRHNRFGTMIWIKREDYKVHTISGQDVLGNAQRSLQKMDKTKKWNKPKYKGRKTEGVDKESTEFDRITHLDSTARKNLRTFVEDFLDSSFNPLFSHLRRAIEREEKRVERRHSAQFFYVVSWFLQAECIRRRKIRQAREQSKGAGSTAQQEDEGFGLIASVMTQETFVLLNRFMQRSHDDKLWTDLKASMRAFTQILLTVQEMSESPSEDDQDIAENILNRIFYEESTHDRIVTLLRSYTTQGFSYLDAVTELSHVFLRMLERYSKQNVDLQVRSKRRARKKKKQVEVETDGVDNSTVDRAEEAEDMAEAQRTVSERKFDFTRFAARFMQQGSVDTFIAFLKFYNDLNEEQLKRAHRFLYRLAFKMEMAIILYRVDILYLFNKMIKGPEGLDSEQASFKEWEELIKQVFRRAVKKIQERPELVVEMLFSKINPTLYYLEHGHEKETITRAPRAPAELEVRPGMERDEQVGVAVSILINQSKSDALQWIKDSLSSAADERKSWESAEAARKALARSALPPADDLDELLIDATGKPSAESTPEPPQITLEPDSEDRRLALFKDNKLRLLLSLLSFTLTSTPSDPQATWAIPSSLSAEALTASLDLIRKLERDPPVFEEGKPPESFLRSKAAAARRRAEFDDDSSADDDQELSLFEPGGPSKSTPSAEAQLAKLKRKRARKQRRTDPTELDEETLRARAKARREQERLKRSKIKSQLTIEDSDEDNEDDEEFFRREAELRERTKANFRRAMAGFKDSPKGSSIPSTPLESHKRAHSDLPNDKSRKKRRGTPVSEDLRSDSENASDGIEDNDGGPHRSDFSDDSHPSTPPTPSHMSTPPSPGSPANDKPRKRKFIKKARVVPDDPEEETTALETDTAPRVPPRLGDSDKENRYGSAYENKESRNEIREVRMADAAMSNDDDYDDDVVITRAPPVARTRGGFVIDSDSE